MSGSESPSRSLQFGVFTKGDVRGREGDDAGADSAGDEIEAPREPTDCEVEQVREAEDRPDPPQATRVKQPPSFGHGRGRGAFDRRYAEALSKLLDGKIAVSRDDETCRWVRADTVEECRGVALGTTGRQDECLDARLQGRWCLERRDGRFDPLLRISGGRIITADDTDIDRHGVLEFSMVVAGFPEGVSNRLNHIFRRMDNEEKPRGFGRLRGHQ
jgi:hypothetical protein